MKLIKKPVTSEVETVETVCEISQAEFSVTCAKIAARFVTDEIGDEPDMEDLAAGLAMAAFLAKYTAQLDSALFDTKPTNENTDKKEEK